MPEMYKVGNKGFQEVDWRSFPVTLPSDLKKMYREKDKNKVKNEIKEKNKTEDKDIDKNE